MNGGRVRALNKTLFYWFLMGLLALLALTGCTKDSEGKVSRQKAAIKVMYWNEASYFNNFGNLFAMKYPYIDVEVVSTQQILKDDTMGSNEALEALIEKEQPDVLMLDAEQFEQLATSGKLVDLEVLIQRDQYNIDTIFPNLVSLLKEKGEGRLYGLAPSFQGNVIYYNADLFAKHGVQLPHDGMTWREIIDTARQFPTDGDEKTRVYGFGAPYSLSWENWVFTIISTYGLKLMDEHTGKLTINTPGWSNVYQLALDGWDSGSFYTDQHGSSSIGDGTMEDYYRRQLFFIGRVAMITGDQSVLAGLEEARQTVKDIKEFDLGMAAGPIDPAEPGYTRDISLRGVYSIRVDSPNMDAAWELIKFINGEDYARVRTRSMNYGVLSRMDYATEYRGHSLEKFYKLKPKLGDGVIMGRTPPGFADELFKLIDRELMLVLEKKKSLTEALETIEAEGQAALDLAREKEQEEQRKKSAENNTNNTS